MKIKILYMVLLLGTNCLSQEIDSNWYIKNHIQDYIADTGTNLPQVALYKTNGDKALLSDYKGKILYIGVWATSCGSSIGNFPYQEQLLKRLKAIHIDTFIQLINIHIDDSKKDWKKSLRKFKPPGINLFCSDTSILEKWRISAPPTYILLDKSNKIIGKEVSIPQEGGDIDYILYSLIQDINIIDALWIKYEQEALLTKYKTASALNNEYFKKWFNLTISSFIEYQNWRTAHFKNKVR